MKPHLLLGCLVIISLLLLSACGTTQPAAPTAPSAPAAPQPAAPAAEPAPAAPETPPASPSPAAPAQQQPSAAPATHQVAIRGFAMNPRELTIKAGDTVTWTNEDSTAHTSTADDGTWDSDRLAKGEAFSFTFTAKGAYTYHCTPHRGSMNGYRIIVG